MAWAMHSKPMRWHLAAYQLPVFGLGRARKRFVPVTTRPDVVVLEVAACPGPVAADTSPHFRTGHRPSSGIEPTEPR